jgi:uncharacterized protein (DUF1501 family)
MTMTLQSVMHVQTGRDGVLSRRSFLRTVSAGAAGLGLVGWRDAVALHADELRRQGRACILLFMRGGPSQFETFDPKPGTATGGPTQAIATTAAGVRIAEGWTRLADQMRHVALIRSLTNREGEHGRAQYQLHTGYIPAGGVRYPSLGSVVASQIGPRDFDLPHFVSVGGGVASIGSGFLGTAYAPFVVGNPNQMPGNVEVPRIVGTDRFGRRLDLMRELEQDFAEAGARARVTQHGAQYDNASRMVRSPRLRAFDLSQEQDAVRDRYGRTPFGQGCLLARRLVEQGVTFVEVESNGWDTHRDNFNLTRNLVNVVDPAIAALVSDLRERGLLERTLVIWMGEFGRTPRINPNTGRDHFPRAFSAALAGAGVRGGMVIGATNDAGTEVARRPVTVPDLFCTFCQALGINPRRENVTPLGRPIRIVDGGQAVRELFA